MTSQREYKCEICGNVSDHPLHWFVIECDGEKLAVYRWKSEIANSASARHCCGEAHAEVFISRWFDSVCVPPRKVLV